MTPGLIKLINNTTLAVFISRSDAAATECPADRWIPGVGHLEISDELLDDPCLVNSKTCWSTVAPNAHHLKDLKVGQVKTVNIDHRGKLVEA